MRLLRAVAVLLGCAVIFGGCGVGTIFLLRARTTVTTGAGSLTAHDRSVDGNALATASALALHRATAFRVDTTSKLGTISDMSEHFGARSDAVSFTLASGRERIVSVGGWVYLKAPGDIIVPGSTPDGERRIQAEVGNRWVRETPAAAAARGMSVFIDRTAAVDGIVRQAGQPHFTTVRRTTIDGVATIELRDARNQVSVYVAASGTPYPVEEHVEIDGVGYIRRFDNWNKPFTAKAPPAGKTISVTALAP